MFSVSGMDVKYFSCSTKQITTITKKKATKYCTANEITTVTKKKKERSKKKLIKTNK